MPSIARIVLPFFLLIILSACSTVNYDDQADQQLTTITQEINLQFISWETQAKSNPVNYDKTYYDRLEADIKTLAIRLGASQDAATVKITGVVNNLSTQVEQFRNFHSANTPLKDSQFFEGERQLLTIQMAALITFELSLKPNATGSPSSKSTSSSTETATTTAKGSAAASKVNATVHKNAVQLSVNQ